jgi:hypothetical protein
VLGILPQHVEGPYEHRSAPGRQGQLEAAAGQPQPRSGERLGSADALGGDLQADDVEVGADRTQPRVQFDRGHRARPVPEIDDEGVGRRACWIALTPDRGPVSLTVSLRLADLGRPSDVADRLPKALIHRNVPGEGVHGFLAALDDAWARQAPQASFGARQRWRATAAWLRAAGWPLLDGPSRWRLGEITVDWSAIAPATRP